MFEAQADRTPAAPAVAWGGGEELTYAELDGSANRLANHLRALGVRPEVRVGVCLERSADMVVALLAVLKAGGAYVPLDPAYPAGRLAFMLEDAAVSVLLTRQQLLGRLPAHGAGVVCLDSDAVEVAARSAERPAGGVGSGNLGYVIYTSGSTGRPKGAMLTQGALRNLVEWNLSVLPEPARTLQYTSHSFDVSFQEIFLTLAGGGTLVLVSDEVRQDPAALCGLLEAEGVERLFLPFMALRQLVEACRERGRRLPALRDIVTAGEQLQVTPALAAWFAGRPGCRLHNHYGPSETHVVTAHELSGDPGAWAPLPPIGAPIPGVRIHLLDEELGAVAPGTPGDLFIGGVALARGYAGRPDLTAERFVPDPAGGEPGGRLYRTGDRARRLPDGSLEFIGRADDQVKVRGYRVEPGEVEVVLASHPAVREVAVVPHETGTGARLLAAYFVTDGGGPAGSEELRRFAADRLPEFMVPSSFVRLDRMPLTPSGKLDRRALPRHGAALRPGQGEGVSPRSELERVLAGLWAEVLGLDGVGVADDFFLLGGDSMRGAVLANRLQERLGEYVYLPTLFEARTVAGLAATLEAHYPAGVARLLGREAGPSRQAGPGAAPRRWIGPEEVAAVRRMVSVLPPRPGGGGPGGGKNPRAAFILSPPRSGSTLLRVMLAGHPGLFAPPELDLLPFGTLAERQALLSGRDGYRLEGAVRAVMELKGMDAEGARGILEELEGAGATTRDFYRKLQEWSGGRLLVDKSTSYAMDPAVLRGAEAGFDRPLYVHLLRHPSAMIRSFEEVRLDRLLVRGNDRFSARELAEVIWTASHRNVLDFLAGVPAERWIRVRFEDLVARPEGVAEELAAFLGVEFTPAMVRPYENPAARMTDGLHAGPESRMVGDVRFHEHAGIDPSVADRWRERRDGAPLDPATLELAAAFGYDAEPGARPAAELPVAPGPASPLSAAAREEARLRNAARLRSRIAGLSPAEVDALLRGVIEERAAE
jgi:amino acid adenylation domain-containing protein